MFNKQIMCSALMVGALYNAGSNAYAAAVIDVPGSADAARVQKRLESTLPEPKAEAPKDYKVQRSSDMPPGAETVTVTATEFEVKGVTAFSSEEIKVIYAPYLNKEITLDKLWAIADEITKLYNDNGYFLSYAYIPQQEVEDGKLTIQVSEGFISGVKVEGELSDSFLLSNAAERLKSYKPIKSQSLEREVLLINDLAGYNFRSVLEPDEKNPGSVTLILIPQEEAPSLVTSFDNYSSRYLGPYSYSAIAQFSILPFQQTSVTFSGVTQADEMRYFTISHQVPLTTALTAEFYGGNVYARPGYDLRQFEVQSQSANLGMALKYYAIRQRDENLTLKLAFDGKNSNTDVLQSPQTRDRVRAARLGFTYENFDSLNGYNSIEGAFSQGLDIFKASQPGELTLSREEARPDFKKAELSISRLQPLAENFALFAAAKGQYSNEPLYSSEEFGYGGIDFGRAYDSSEITGDSGVAGSLELRYYTTSYMETSVIPYVFYDIGKVWNRDASNTAISGSSSGFGVRLSNFGISSNLSVAYPLTKQVDTPVSSNDKAPRYLFQISYGF